MTEELVRCEWSGDGQMRRYHDEEWGRPEHDDGRLFEMLILEGAQAGLSWSTILKKRDSYRRAFDDFTIDKVAAYGADKVESLLQDAGIVRNRLKVQSTIGNAIAVQKIQEEVGSFDAFLWAYVDNQPVINQWQSIYDLPAKTPLAEQLSKDLLKRGFKFVGPTIVYSFMQAIGMVNDHITKCFAYEELVQS